MIKVNLRKTLPGPIAAGKFAAAALAAGFLMLAPAAFAQPATPAPAEQPAADPADPGLPTLEAAPVAEAAPAAEATEAAPAEGEGGEAFSIRNLWSDGDIVARTTLILMVIMSVGSWLIFITKMLDQNSLMGQAKRIGRFWEAGSVDDGLKSLGSKNAFTDIAESAQQAASYGDTGLMGKISRSDRLSHRVAQAAEGISNRLAGGMAFLASVGSISPFVGLFGTVWGIVNALIKIGNTGEASIDKVAGPVGEALYMTAIGLAVAVPAVLFYNFLGRRNKMINDTARHFAVDVEQLMQSNTKS